MKRTHFSRWAVTDPSFTPKPETSLFIPDISYAQLIIDLSGGNTFVVEADSIIILVNENRELYEFDLKLMTFSEGGAIPPSQSRNFSHQPYCQSSYILSNNGHRLVAYYTTCPQRSDFTKTEPEDEQPKSRNSNKTRIQLRFVELSGTSEQTQKIELEYLEPDLLNVHYHPIAFSPDLSMVRAGSYIFDLQVPDYPPLSFPGSLLRYRHGQSVSFSPCNGYLTIILHEDTVAESVRVIFGLFRICRSAGRIEKLATKCVEDLVDYIGWAAFHPMLPLLLLTCSACPTSDMRKDLKATKVVEIDLREPKLVPIVLFQKLVLMGFKYYWAYFS